MAERFLWGAVSASGDKDSGSDGWSVENDGEGLYIITFDPKFNSAPGFAVTQIYPGEKSGGGDTRDNAVIVKVDHLTCKVKTGDDAGHAENRAFSFIAVGYQSA